MADPNPSTANDDLQPALVKRDQQHPYLRTSTQRVHIGRLGALDKLRLIFAVLDSCYSAR